MEFVDQSDQTFLGTSQGGIPGTPNLTRRFERSLERFGTVGEHPVHLDAMIDAVIFGKSQLLQSIYSRFCNLRISVARAA